MRTSDFLGEIRGNEQQDTGNAHAATRDTLIHFPDVNMRKIEVLASLGVSSGNRFFFLG